MTGLTLDTISLATLAAAADENFAVHAAWVPQQTAGMQVIDEKGLTLVDAGLPCDTFNIICCARLSANQAANKIHSAIDYFHSVGRPFSWWVGPADQPAHLGDLLVEAGLQPAETELAMAVDLAALQKNVHHPGGLPDGLQVRRVHTVAELQDFAHVVAANWTPPDSQVKRFYDLAAPVILAADSPQWLYVGYLNNQPVATAELTVGGGVVGLYNICTLADVRRQGIGTALTLQPLLAARAYGMRTAVLQAAAAGEGIYRRLGFTPFGSITEYKPHYHSGE